jgi:hypothetical protein
MKKTIFLLFILMMPACFFGQSKLVHPGMLNSKTELDFIKNKINAGEEPWISSFKLLQSDDHAKLEWQPKPIADVIRGSYNNPNIGAGDLGNDAQAAYIQSLEWILTGNKQYAKKAIEIMNAWSFKLKSISGSDMQLLAGITGYKFCNAAEIIRHTSKLWNKKDQRQFEQMLLNLFYPLVKNYKPRANGNWDAAMITTTMCIGIFVNDAAMYHGAVEYAKSGQSNGAIPNYISESGQCQESGRDQQHTQLGLGFLADLCEIAWKQGDDLYGAFDNRVAAGFEYTAKYNLGEEVDYKSVPDLFGKNQYAVISDKGRGNFRPVYEKIYHHYHDLKGLEMKYTKRILDQIRPEGFHWDHSSFGTLFYHQLPAKK